MRSYNPKDEYDQKRLAELKPEPWMLDLVKCNPSYCCWGPHEDYMASSDSGWASRILKETWADMKDWHLDDYNECINFYFEINQPSKDCPHCHNGYTNEAWEIMERLGYNAKSYDRDVISHLKKEYKGFDENSGPLAIDCLRQHTALKYICDRDGVTFNCSHCNGNGYEITGDAYVSLILWMLVPRKGCSRGVEIKKITQKDLPSIFKWLKEARKRNEDRFSGLDSFKQRNILNAKKAKA